MAHKHFKTILMPLPDELYNIKFAGYFESIKEMYKSDKKFKTLCDEYCTCVSNAKNYEKQIKKDLHHKTASENLSLELEEEILFYIVRNR